MNPILEEVDRGSKEVHENYLQMVKSRTATNAALREGKKRVHAQNEEFDNAYNAKKADMEKKQKQISRLNLESDRNKKIINV